MAAPLVVPMTPGITVSGDYIIRITALDATTGNLVTGVKISAGAILASNVIPLVLPTLTGGLPILVPGPGE